MRKFKSIWVFPADAKNHIPFSTSYVLFSWAIEIQFSVEERKQKIANVLQLA